MSRPSLDPYRGWTSVTKQLIFETSVDLLIDNFMDPTHNALVHDGLIRSSSQIEEHELTVHTSPRGVRVNYSEQEERVGFGMRFLFGNTMRTEHCDEFLAPNLVRVTYVIEGAERFVALISCIPLTAEDCKTPRTLALVQLRFKFGFLSPLLRPVVAALANKVLKQDFQITRDQWLNQQAFADERENLVAADAVATRVNQFRRDLVDGKLRDGTTEQTLSLRF